MKKFSSSKGMTLIEIVISLAILGIIAVAFLNVFTSGFSSIFLTGNRNYAVKKAQAVIDKIYELPRYDSLSTEIPNVAASFPSEIFRSKTDINALNNDVYDGSETVRYCIENVSGNLTGITGQKVTVLVFYKNGKQKVSLSAVFPEV